MLLESSYVCGSCGEEIVVSVDPSAGREQEYFEDCPVCCRPHRLRITLEGADDVRVQAQEEGS